MSIKSESSKRWILFSKNPQNSQKILKNIAKSSFCSLRIFFLVGLLRLQITRKMWNNPPVGGLNVQGTGHGKNTKYCHWPSAHNLKLEKSAENSQRGASGADCMAHNVINDHCEFAIGVKRNDRTSGKRLFHQKVTPPPPPPPCTMHHAPHIHFRTQIERRSPAICDAIFVISRADREFLDFLWRRPQGSFLDSHSMKV
jgi:hypothetical protein